MYWACDEFQSDSAHYRPKLWCPSGAQDLGSRIQSEQWTVPKDVCGHILDGKMGSQGKKKKEQAIVFTVQSWYAFMEYKKSHAGDDSRTRPKSSTLGQDVEKYSNLKSRCHK